MSRKAVTRKEVLASRHGRFHDDPVAEPTTYVADSPETAWLEVNARFGRIAGNPEAFRLFRVTIAGAELADLRESKDRALLMKDPPPALCKETARKLRQAETGRCGLIYPSLRNQPGGVCAAIFLERTKKLEVEPAEEEWRAYKEKHR